MSWFYDMRTVNKVLMAFGLVLLIVVSIAAIGFDGLKAMNGYLGGMHDEQFSVALSAAEMGAKLNGVRAALLAMMATKERAGQDKLREQIDTLTKQIDQTFSDLLAARLADDLKARVKKVQEPWRAFRDTRDRELIPLILAGKLDQANALATGAQAERFQAFSGGAAQLIKDAREQALRFKQDGESRYTASVVLLATLCGAGLVFGAGLAFLLGRALAGPLGQAVDVLESVAHRDFTRRLDISTRDEVGQMARSLNQAIAEVRDAMREVQSAAEEAASASGQLSTAASEQSAGAEEQASALQETAASLEELAGTVRQTADNASQANQLARGSRDAAAKGGQVVTSAVASMQEITRASKRIVEKIGRASCRERV